MTGKKSKKATSQKGKKTSKESDASVSAAPSEVKVTKTAASVKKSEAIKVSVRKRKGKLGANDVRKVIVDTDPGTDDAIAILMLLRDPSIQVLAITVTQGNAVLENTSRNALRVVNVAKRKDVPVYAGAHSSLLDCNVEYDNFYGVDGMGDVVTEHDRDLGKLQDEKAVPALVRLVDEHEGEITLLCIGPLTNVAIAQKIDRSFGSKLKECFIMGGNYTGLGNVTSSAEFNFYRDPEAASIVLRELACPITLIPWELCYSQSYSWDWYSKITNTNTPISQFLKAIGAEMARNAKEAGNGFTPADEIASACLINDKLALETQDVVCDVELAGFKTRGQMVVDWKTKSGKGTKSVRVVKKLDVEKFKAMMELLTSNEVTCD